jgi:hypothetical protein
MDAVSVGGGMGFNVNSSMTYTTDSHSIGETYSALSANLATYRACKNFAFSEEDRKSVVSK